MLPQLSNRVHLLAIVQHAEELAHIISRAGADVPTILPPEARAPLLALREHFEALAPWLDADFWARVGGPEAQRAVPPVVAAEARAVDDCGRRILSHYRLDFMQVNGVWMIWPPGQTNVNANATFYPLHAHGGPVDPAEHRRDAVCLAKALLRMARRLTKAVDEHLPPEPGQFRNGGVMASEPSAPEGGLAMTQPAAQRITLRELLQLQISGVNRGTSFAGQRWRSGAYRSQPAAFRPSRAGRGGKVQVRTGLGKSRCPGSQGGLRKRGQGSR
jgi:hypothetical protein